MSTNLPHPEIWFEFEGQKVLARTGQRAYQFPFAASLRISMSRAWSATNFFNRAGSGGDARSWSELRPKVDDGSYRSMPLTRLEIVDTQFRPLYTHAVALG